ncbi:mechanosensitive ion channel family protein [Ureibacillus massiliensis]|uniref:mechanosensitive ion channel family protein n=1 Tax=Ureibacillus massiliensis TaxID=292806 RepID=UPI000569B6E4|nr:mechanosensitive ion channel family protein [Ureibacillus massiliensis]
MTEENIEINPESIAKTTGRFWSYFTSEELWDYVIASSIKIISILLISYLVIFIGKKIITRLFTLRFKTPLKQSERRQTTLVKLLHSVLTYVVYFSAIIAVLSALKIEVMGLLAGAGIAGLAIGFGAQSLVKDVITGFFIILEDQFAVGDYVKLTTSNVAEGTVSEIGLRTTKLVAFTGELYIIPNGQIMDVVNYSINNSKGIIDLQVGIEADIEKIERLVTDYLQTLPAKYEELVSVPIFVGVQNIVGTEVTVRIVVETQPYQHFAISRIIKRDVKDIFEKNGIPMPYQKMMVYNQDSNKNGGDDA